MVFYRKYRPQTLAQLDSEDVRTLLSATLQGKEIPHAFLFTGPKGLGKTSTARILAKAINCENTGREERTRIPVTSASIEPCNTCQTCITITHGTNVDIFEIDGASNRGIDEMRDLREKIRLAPVSVRKKVYIIDEVHMLTTEAFNALLKTLEEPPDHAVFVLCTTEPQKIPATIFSRCFHIPFKRAIKQDIVQSLKRISEGEKIQVEEGVLQHVATLADGGFRDAAKIFEEIVLLAGGKPITNEHVEKLYKFTTSDIHMKQLLSFLGKRDLKQALKVISVLAEEGCDMKYVLEQLIAACHALLLVKAGIEEIVSDEEDLFSLEEVKTLITLFSKAYGDIKYAVLPQIPLELAIIEYMNTIGEQDSARDLDVSQQKNLSSTLVANSAVHATQPVTPSPTRKARIPVKDSQLVSVASSQNDLWLQFIESIKAQNFSLAAVLRSCLPKGVDKTSLTIEAAYKFHRDKLSEEKAKVLLETAWRKLTGNSVQVSIVLKG